MSNHLGGYYENGDFNTWMPDIWGYLILKYDIKSVIDIGCGTGFNMEYFDQLGIPATGVEGHPDAVRIGRANGRNITEHDYTTGPLSSPHDFDLAICTEFVEHVDAEYQPNWMETMKSCRYVLISHALPGQGGYHHVNEQFSEYWHEYFRANGFKLMHNETDLLRKTNDRIKARWGRNTLMLFANIHK
jgi:SAM-dependent methyltransferase